MSKTIKYIIQTSKGPKPVGPYNQAVRVNNVVYLSGVIGLDAKTNQIVPGGVESETKQIFQNMEAVLKAAGSSFEKIVKASVFLNDINDFGKVNEIYKQCYRLVRRSIPASLKGMMKPSQDVASLDEGDVLHLTVLHAGRSHVQALMEITADITKDHPARSAYQVGKLPVGAKVEIEAIALCGDVDTQYITE